MSTVLTRKGVGTVLCPKCNILNIVGDDIFQCHCGFIANIIDCACNRCGDQLLDKNKGRSRQYISRHSSIHGESHPNWKET